MKTTKLGLALAATMTASLLGTLPASATPFSIPSAPTTTDTAVETVDYIYGDRAYCWYYDGWHGPGWYWCGYSWRRGYGWGSPVWGWNGWAWGGPRYYRGGGYRGGPRGGYRGGYHGHH